MGKRFAHLLCAGVCIAAMASAAGSGKSSKAVDDDPVHGGVHSFATLPERSTPTGAPLGHPEGLCADAEGNIYANTFEFFQQNYIYTFNRQGKLITTTPTPATVSPAGPVAPLGCTVMSGKLYVNDVLSGSELEYTLPLTDASVPNVFPVCGGALSTDAPTSARPPCFLNAVTALDEHLYITDNGDALFGDVIGRIWMLDPATGIASRFIDNPPELQIAPGPYVGATPPQPLGFVLPFSANGIAFSRDGAALYVANMSTNIIYKQKVTNCGLPGGCERHGGLTVFSHDPQHLIQGPDNMDFDDRGNLWIASGQNDHVVVLNRDGDIATVFGSFKGFDKDGAPKELLQPSGVIFANGTIYVGNESSQTLRPDNSLLPADAQIDWGALKLFTISRITAEVPDNGK